jgi:hypothetical protein
MKNYFLILLGNFENESETKDIVVSLSPIVDSPTLKFNQTTGSLVFHFASEVSQEEMYDYIIVTVSEKCTSFFLTENTDKVSVFLPTSVSEHLLDLDKETMDLKWKPSKNFDEELDEEIVALLLEGIKKSRKKPTLDEILEKILSGGVNSLSLYEKEILENYSKN